MAPPLTDRFFNTAGPVRADWHYLIDPLTRWDMEDILRLIAQGKYFVLHAPRQTGKTSCLLALMDYLNGQGYYQALYVNVEAAQAARNDIDKAMTTLCRAVAYRGRDYLQNSDLLPIVETVLATHDSTGALAEILSRWAAQTERPIVLMLDEVDALVGDTLISLLRQLRAGYTQRPQGFPLSVILCGVRDVRDYRMHTADQEVITGGSAFNIKAESLRLGNFIESEVMTLLRQHTDTTGQIFAPDALDYVWQQTQGQPWLVNALAYQACFKLKAGRDRTQTITLELMKTAREDLIQRRDTHLEQLTDKLKEPRVHRVIATLLKGIDSADSLHPLDTEYVKDLGLITVSINGATQIANPIYQEIIPRELIWGWQMGIVQAEQWYQTADGRLDMPKLLRAFQQFFRENSEAWIERFDYKEAGPQLLLQAFLQRILNGGGRLTREYGLGRRRTDLFIEWPLDKAKSFLGPVQRIVLELKILRKSLAITLAEGLTQTADYADKSGAEEAHLICFDRDPNVSWDEKLFERVEPCQDRTIYIWGM
ncbi:MAG: AAA-like domain-containing protein [Cyanobacteria bacterium P01_A01_bin.114]